MATVTNCAPSTTDGGADARVWSDVASTDPLEVFVALSNRDQTSAYRDPGEATRADSAAFSNVRTPSLPSRGSTSGLTAGSQARTTLSRRLISVVTMWSAAPGSLYRAFATMARMASSEKRETSRAPQNASSARMLSNAGFGYSGRHLTGSNASPSKRPTAFAPSQ